MKKFIGATVEEIIETLEAGNYDYYVFRDEYYYLDTITEIMFFDNDEEVRLIIEDEKCVEVEDEDDM